MYHYTIFLLIFLIVFTICNVTTLVLRDDSNDWDYIIFTQHWPVTVCVEWQNKNPTNKCTFPPDANAWSIHGLWPTKKGTEGPSFCNKTWHFDPKQIEPFEDSLERYWTNVEANTKLTSLWKHEWTKHGTCAAQLPQLYGEANYFHQGIIWAQRYDLAEILAKNNVVPNTAGYTLDHIHQVIVNATGKKPIIQCVTERKTKLNLLFEIRLCLDKSLELVDCDLLGVHEEYGKTLRGVLSNCNDKRPIMYYNKIPLNFLPGYLLYKEIEHEEWFYEKYQYMNKLRTILDTLQFLIWLTR